MPWNEFLVLRFLVTYNNNAADLAQMERLLATYGESGWSVVGQSYVPLLDSIVVTLQRPKEE